MYHNLCALKHSIELINNLCKDILHWLEQLSLTGKFNNYIYQNICDQMYGKPIIYRYYLLNNTVTY